MIDELEKLNISELRKRSLTKDERVQLAKVHRQILRLGKWNYDTGEALLNELTAKSWADVLDVSPEIVQLAALTILAIARKK